MSEPDVIVNLHGFKLPRDYAWRVGFVAAVKRGLRNRGYDDRGYRPPRFVWYYFNRAQPVAVCADGRINLPLEAPLKFLPEQVDAVTHGQFRIVPAKGETDPLYLLIHDGWDGACWLRRFGPGLRALCGSEPNPPEQP